MKGSVMAKEIEFFFDIFSPHSYLAATQVEKSAKRVGASVVWKPFNHKEITAGADNPTAMTIPAKLNYLVADITRHVIKYGVPFAMPEYFPFDSATAQSALAWTAKEHGNEAGAKLSKAFFDAVWAKGLDIRDDDTITKIADECGLNGADILNAAKSDAGKQALAANTKQAAEKGAFGSPTFLVGDDMYWGQDRLSMIEEALA